MQHPGVFFIERTAVQKIHSHRRNWVLYRHYSQALRFKVMSDWRQFYTNMAEILRTPAWENLGPTSNTPTTPE